MALFVFDIIEDLGVDVEEEAEGDRIDAEKLKPPPPLLLSSPVEGFSLLVALLPPVYLSSLGVRKGEEAEEDAACGVAAAEGVGENEEEEGAGSRDKRSTDTKASLSLAIGSSSANIAAMLIS